MFSLDTEIILFLNPQDQHYTDENHAESFKLVIGGGDEHDTTWLSVLDKEKSLETRIQSKSTPHILSNEDLRSFWIRVGYKESHSSSENTITLEFGLGPIQTPSIISWPVGRKFVLRHIGVKQLPGNKLDIR